MIRLRLISILFGSLVVGACNSEGSSGAISDAALDGPDLVGCRSPEEPGCSRCCAVDAGSCTEYSWNSGGVPNPPTPWYDVIIYSCDPVGCPVCASCTVRDEEDLRRLIPRPECDCTQPTGIDPCSAAGCECYCETWLRLRAACPTVAASL
jgi:hypothetical protein